MSEALKAIKTEQITHCIAAADIPQLKHFCRTPYGLVSAQLRYQAWPLLVGLDPEYYSNWNRKT
jgi:hypothetical protein